MELIIKEIYVWTIFLEEIDKLKDEYGSSIVDNGIVILSFYKKKKIYDVLQSIDNPNKLFALLARFHIDDIDVAINFLNSIRNIYRFSSTIASLLEIKERYGAQKLAFINNGADKYLTVETFTTRNKSRKAYFAKEIYPFVTMDFKTYGINKVSFFSGRPFIIDDIDRADHTIERTIYTADFRLNCDTLPLKEEMDKENINRDRDYMFIRLLEQLHVLINDININLIKDDPNGVYLKPEVVDFNNYFTFRCDGVVRDNNHNELKPGDYPAGEVIINNANFGVFAQIINGVVSKINLVVSPSYLEYIYPILSSDLFDLLSYLESISVNLDRSRIMFR